MCSFVFGALLAGFSVAQDFESMPVVVVLSSALCFIWVCQCQPLVSPPDWTKLVVMSQNNSLRSEVCTHLQLPWQIFFLIFQCQMFARTSFCSSSLAPLPSYIYGNYLKIFICFPLKFPLFWVQIHTKRRRAVNPILSFKAESSQQGESTEGIKAAVVVMSHVNDCLISGRIHNTDEH